MKQELLDDLKAEKDEFKERKKFWDDLIAKLSADPDFSPQRQYEKRATALGKISSNYQEAANNIGNIVTAFNHDKFTKKLAKTGVGDTSEIAQAQIDIAQYTSGLGKIRTGFATGISSSLLNKRGGKRLAAIVAELASGDHENARKLLSKERLTLWDRFVMRPSKKKEFEQNKNDLLGRIRDHEIAFIEKGRLEKGINGTHTVIAEMIEKICKDDRANKKFSFFNNSKGDIHKRLDDLAKSDPSLAFLRKYLLSPSVTNAAIVADLKGDPTITVAKMKTALETLGKTYTQSYLDTAQKHAIASNKKTACDDFITKCKCARMCSLMVPAGFRDTQREDLITTKLGPAVGNPASLTDDQAEALLKECDTRDKNWITDGDKNEIEKYAAELVDTGKFAKAQPNLLAEFSSVAWKEQAYAGTANVLSGLRQAFTHPIQTVGKAGTTIKDWYSAPKPAPTTP